MKLPRFITESRMPRWLQIVAGLVSLTLLVLIAMVLARWPYRRATVLESLQEGFSTKIEAADYHLTFFPAPGFVADQLVFHRNGEPAMPPLATITRLTATSSYATILFAPDRFQTIRIEGLHVQIPAPGTSQQSSSDAEKKTKSTMVVEHLIADAAQLDVTTEAGKEPLHFDIPRLHLTDVSAKRAMSFSTIVIEPTMHGELHSEGDLGPIHPADPGKTNVSATYKLINADLASFHALSGTLASSGKFRGPLERIMIDGIVDVPNFRVKQDHPIHLNTDYNAIVNATDGDVALTGVTAKFDRTAVFSDGNIAGKPKTASLDLAVDSGRIQDLMSIFIQDAPPMNGTISLKAKATLPSSKEPFLKRLQMDGDFGIGGGRFTKPTTRYNMDAFSERASEEKPPKDDPNPPPVISDVKGHVVARNGIATFTSLSFSVPGATALLNGTCNLIEKQIHLAGDLHMDQDISHTTTGIKSVFLKPLAPFFKKKNKATVVPIQITGTFKHPVVGPNLMAKLK